MFSSGALFGSQASQGFATGGTQPDGLATQGASQRPRQEVKEICLPVTIRAVEVAFEQRGETGADLKFYGCVEPQMVIVVAAVESVVRSGASLEVMLNDGTGRIKARYFVMDQHSDELERIVPNSYVSAFGEVRAAPVQHLSLKGMRPVETADEVSYHMIEAAHAALQLQKGPSGQPKEPATPAKATSKDEAMAAPVDQLTPQKPGTVPAAVTAGAPSTVAAEPVAAVAAKPQPDAPLPAKGPPTGAELRAAVLGLLRDAAVGPEGLHLDAVAQKVGSAGAEVRSMVAELVDDGELFSTITEEHFAAV